jgi:2-amino-4-hydroxy-6-hydroxymethyldihydropteridine diphosphokinase
MHRCLISFGANIGDARGSVLAAEELLKQLLPTSDSVRLSPLYQTPPVGGPSGQAPFVNAVATVETRLNPWEIWHVIRSIEAQLGRERIRRWEARRIDLDILLFDQMRIWTPQLKIPHPRMCMRRFILQPAADVAADWLDPVSQQTIGDLASRLSASRSSLILASPPALPGQLVLQRTACQDVRHTSVDEMLRPNAVVARSSSNSWRSAAHSDTVLLMQRLDHPLALSQTATKLIIFWESAAEDSAWEDEHRKLAVQLRLTDFESAKSIASPLPLIGPRYLLATSDPDWAAHEVTAALEAMDCQVEPYS